MAGVRELAEFTERRKKLGRPTVATEEAVQVVRTAEEKAAYAETKKAARAKAKAKAAAQQLRVHIECSSLSGCSR